MIGLQALTEATLHNHPLRIMQSIFSSAARLRVRRKQRDKIVEPRR